MLSGTSYSFDILRLNIPNVALSAAFQSFSYAIPVEFFFPLSFSQHLIYVRLMQLKASSLPLFAFSFQPSRHQHFLHHPQSPYCLLLQLLMQSEL